MVGDLLDTVWQELESENSNDFHKRLSKKLNLSLKRLKDLYKFIHGEVKLDEIAKINIQAYLAKRLKPEEYDLVPLTSHWYSEGSTFSYDPAKCGQNILMHGLCFNEVVSYAKGFGELIVPRKNARDGERLVVFSNLKYLSEQERLVFPLGASSQSYVLSIVALDGLRFRFISSRVLSSKRDNYVSAIKRALKEEGEGLNNDSFTNFCIAYLEGSVFGNSPTSSS